MILKTFTFFSHLHDNSSIFSCYIRSMTSNKDISAESDCCHNKPKNKLYAFLQDDDFAKRIASELEHFNYAQILTSLATQSIQHNKMVQKDEKDTFAVMHKDLNRKGEIEADNHTEAGKSVFLQNKKRRIIPSRKLREIQEMKDTRLYRTNQFKRQNERVKSDGKTSHVHKRKNDLPNTCESRVRDSWESEVRQNEHNQKTLMEETKSAEQQTIPVKITGEASSTEGVHKKDEMGENNMRRSAVHVLKNLKETKIESSKFELGKVPEKDSNDNSLIELENEILDEKTRYQCKQCGKYFKTYYTFSVHVKMPDHTKDYPFVCNVCGKGFRLSSTLCRHKIIHTTDKPHECKICQKTFNRSSTLKMHIRTHSARKQHVCTICGKGFHQKGNLRNHMFVHSGERPFCCETCGRHFNKKSNLKHHVKIHEMNGKYACTLCKREFDSHSALKDHTKTKHIHL